MDAKIGSPRWRRRVAKRPLPRPGMCLISHGASVKLLMLGARVGEVKAGRVEINVARLGEVKSEIPRLKAKDELV